MAERFFKGKEAIVDSLHPMGRRGRRKRQRQRSLAVFAAGFVHYRASSARRWRRDRAITRRNIPENFFPVCGF